MKDFPEWKEKASALWKEKTRGARKALHSEQMQRVTEVATEVVDIVGKVAAMKVTGPLSLLSTAVMLSKTARDYVEPPVRKVKASDENALSRLLLQHIDEHYPGALCASDKKQVAACMPFLMAERMAASQIKILAVSEDRRFSVSLETYVEEFDCDIITAFTVGKLDVVGRDLTFEVNSDNLFDIIKYVTSSGCKNNAVKTKNVCPVFIRARRADSDAPKTLLHLKQYLWARDDVTLEDGKIQIKWWNTCTVCKPWLETMLPWHFSNVEPEEYLGAHDPLEMLADIKTLQEMGYQPAQTLIGPPGSGKTTYVNQAVIAGGLRQVVVPSTLIGEGPAGLEPTLKLLHPDFVVFEDPDHANDTSMFTALLNFAKRASSAQTCIIVSVNDLSRLPFASLRVGRIGEPRVFLAPSTEDRVTILRHFMTKSGADLAAYDVNALACEMTDKNFTHDYVCHVAVRAKIYDQGRLLEYTRWLNQHVAMLSRMHPVQHPVAPGDSKRAGQRPADAASASLPPGAWIQSSVTEAEPDDGTTI